MDEAHLTKPLLVTLEKVLFDYAFHFSWGKRVQVKGILDRNNDGTFTIQPVRGIVIQCHGLSSFDLSRDGLSHFLP
jgi:hypothetical protein